MTMIYGIGVDIIQIKRIEKAISRWGDRFINRVFTQNEVITCNNRPSPFSAFALRFAAKEAFSKAVEFFKDGDVLGIYKKRIEVLKQIIQLLNSFNDDSKKGVITKVDKVWNLLEINSESNCFGVYTRRIAKRVF